LPLKPHILFCLDAKKYAKKIKRPHPAFGHPLLTGEGKEEDNYLCPASLEKLALDN